MVRMSRKEAIFYGISTKKATVDDIPVDNEEKIKGEVGQQSGSEVTVMEIYYL